MDLIIAVEGILMRLLRFGQNTKRMQKGGGHVLASPNIPVEQRGSGLQYKALQKQECLQPWFTELLLVRL